MTYNDRLRRYEAEKQRLRAECPSYTDYEKRLKELAKKWRI